jgi:hypothetical protein
MIRLTIFDTNYKFFRRLENLVGSFLEIVDGLIFILSFTLIYSSFSMSWLCFITKINVEKNKNK